MTSTWVAHLVDVILCYNVVEAGVKVIEKVDDFEWCAHRRQCCEPNDV